jgi:hypothetical protein
VFAITHLFLTYNYTTLWCLTVIQTSLSSFALIFQRVYPFFLHTIPYLACVITTLYLPYFYRSVMHTPFVVTLILNNRLLLTLQSFREEICKHIHIRRLLLHGLTRTPLSLLLFFSVVFFAPTIDTVSYYHYCVILPLQPQGSVSL